MNDANDAIDANDLIDVNDAIVKYRDIYKSYGELEVLKGFNLDVHRGEKLALIGPSGSGKTTIIRMLMTLEQPTNGTIEVDGELLWHEQVKGKLVPASEKHLRNVRKKIGMVFQHFHLFPHMNILKNCTSAPIHVLGLSKEEAEQRAIDMLKKVGLEDKLTNYPSQLSGGQQQRVAIARALVMQPKVMLFDEVTSALDPETVGEVLAILRDIALEGEVAMVLVTHEMEFAREVADRVVFLDQGVIAEEGHPQQVLVNPQSERLQTFLKRFISNEKIESRVISTQP